MNRRRLTILYSGRVQGVGFRYSVKSLAAGYELTGTVRNLPNGGVELIAEGDGSELEAFQQAIRESDVGGFIRDEDARWSAVVGGMRGFEIVH